MRVFRKLSSFSFCALLITGCASNFDADLQKIRIGDDKPRVLELLGNPKRTTRIKDNDRWTYSYQKNGQEQLEHIDFRDGKVIKIADKTGSNSEVSPENAETYEDYEKSILKRRKK